MRGASAIRRAGGCVVVAAALAGATAGQAGAMAAYGPGCAARLVPAPAGSASCGFDSPTDYATIYVVPTGPVTATVRCNYYGYTYTTSRSGSANFSFRAHTPGSCNLSLTGAGSGAVATAVPTVPPIYEPPPPAA